MRKQYSKPEIMFEDFSLSESIAAGCNVIIPEPVSDECGWPLEGSNNKVMFLVSMNGCNRQVDDNINNGFCYHVPVDGSMLFNS